MEKNNNTTKILLNINKDIKSKLEEIAKKNGSKNLTFTINSILEDYLELYGVYHNPADNIFLQEFKNQITETQNNFTDQINIVLNKMVDALNINTEAFTNLAVADKENNIQMSRLLDLIENEMGYLEGDNIDFTEGGNER